MYYKPIIRGEPDDQYSPDEDFEGDDSLYHNSWHSLENKLRMLAEGEEIELTPQEAAVYGVEDADQWPEDLTEQEDDGY